MLPTDFVIEQCSRKKTEKVYISQIASVSKQAGIYARNEMR